MNQWIKKKLKCLDINVMLIFLKTLLDLNQCNNVNRILFNINIITISCKLINYSTFFSESITILLTPYYYSTFQFFKFTLLLLNH